MRFFILALVAVFNMGASDERIAIERRIEERVNDILRSVDPAGFGFVEVVYQQESITLPASPFKITGTMDINANTRSKISAVKIEVFTSSGEVFPDLQATLEKSARPYFEKATITSSKAPIPPAAPPIRADWRDPRYLTAGAIGFVALAMALCAGLLALMQTRSARRAIQSLANIAAGLEAFGGNKSRTSSKGESSAANTTVAAQGDGDVDTIVDLPVEAVRALLVDSYWCKRDGYASYLWRRLQVKTRFELLDNEKLLKDYVVYIQSVEPRAEAYHLEAYYMAPLPIGHLDNAALTEAVRKEPALFFHLSSMRAEAVELTALERINILQMQADVGQKKVSTDFGKLQPSTQRALRKTIHFHIASIEDEMQILAKDVPLEIMAQVPTLGLAQRLEDNKLQEILKNYSAQELAEAWIGPEDILQRFGRVLPEKKLTLVANYRKTVQPRRDSDAFIALRDQIVASLEQTTAPLQETIATSTNEGESSAA